MKYTLQKPRALPFRCAWHRNVWNIENEPRPCSYLTCSHALSILASLSPSESFTASAILRLLHFSKCTTAVTMADLPPGSADPPSTRPYFVGADVNASGAEPEQCHVEVDEAHRWLTHVSWAVS